MTTLTLKFKDVEAEILDNLVEKGLFATKSEAIRAAIVKYAMDLGYFNRKEIWKDITSYPKRNVSPEQLKKDLERLEDET